MTTGNAADTRGWSSRTKSQDQIQSLTQICSPTTTARSPNPRFLLSLQRNRKIDALQTYLGAQTDVAAEDDHQVRDYLLSQKLTIKHQYPVQETLLHLDKDKLATEQLIDPML